MIEEEAKTKWCPFARQVWKAEAGADLSMNRDGAGNPTAFCIASACMAWRQSHPKETREDHSGAGGYMAKRAVDTGRIVRREGGPGSLGHLILDAVGHCGLAGKP